jgi:hypothetical protein
LPEHSIRKELERKKPEEKVPGPAKSRGRQFRVQALIDFRIMTDVIFPLLTLHMPEDYSLCRKP